MGQNATGHTCWPRSSLSFGEGAALPLLRGRPSDIRSPPPRVPGVLRGARLGPLGERDLEMVADEVRPFDLQSLECLGQDQVSLVRANPDEQLVSSAVNVHVVP